MYLLLEPVKLFLQAIVKWSSLYIPVCALKFQKVDINIKFIFLFNFQTISFQCDL